MHTGQGTTLRDKQRSFLPFGLETTEGLVETRNNGVIAPMARHSENQSFLAPLFASLAVLAPGLSSESSIFASIY